MFGRIGIKWHIPQPCRTGSVPRAQRFCEFCSGFEKTMNGNKTLLRVGIKMKRAQWTLLVAALLASGCSWDESAYNTWVKDGELSLCMGACILESGKVDKATCENLSKELGKYEIQWIDDYKCVDKEGGDLYQKDDSGEDVEIIDKKTCSDIGGEWKAENTGYCRILTAKACTRVGNWVDYYLRMIDMHDGRYARITEDDKIICGDYDSVVKGKAPNCSDSKTIELMKGAIEGGGINLENKGQGNNKCPNTSSQCVPVVYTAKNVEGEMPKGVMAMCSSCPLGSAMCIDDGKAACFDLNNNKKHCGSCENECSEGKSCVDGECVEVRCDFKCPTDEEDICVLRSKAKYCGVKDCEELKDYNGCGLNWRCAESTTAEFGYECVCREGLVLYKKDVNDKGECIDPTSDEYCGAVGGIGEDAKGVKCDPNKSTCSKNTKKCDLCVNGHILCGGKCINPRNDNTYCGAKEGCIDGIECKNGTECRNALCLCKLEEETKRENKALCGKYPDPSCVIVDEETSTDATYAHNHCGAKGRCSDVSPESPDYQGKACGKNQICKDKECVCSDNDFFYSPNCPEECYDMTDNKSCGVTECPEDGIAYGIEFKIENNDYVVTGNCELLGESYCDAGKCVCDYSKGAIVNDENGVRCVNLNTDVRYCGGTDASNACAKAEMCQNGKCKSLVCEGEGEWTVCGGKCVKIDDGHIDKECICKTGYCNSDGDLTNGCEQSTGTENNCKSCGDKCGQNQRCTIEDGCVCLDEPDIIEISLNNGGDKKCIKLSEVHMTRKCLGEDEYCCEEWYYDLDGNVENGCEIDLKNNTEYCGKDRVNCKEVVVNADSISCSDGVCSYLTCIDGYKDCDSNSANGCEIDMKNNIYHCGGCNIECPVYKNVEEGVQKQAECNESSVCCFSDVDLIDYAGEVVCCSGQTKYGYASTKGYGKSNGCPENERYGCFKSAPDNECWVEME